MFWNPWNQIVRLIFPSRCLGCEATVAGNSVLCDGCRESIPINKNFFCGRCGARLAEFKKICHLDAPYVLGAAADYQNKLVGDLIRTLKFRFVKAAAEPLAQLLIKYLEGLRATFPNWAVVPVPLSSKRLRARAFNQAELIARIIALHFGWPVVPAVERVRDAKPQSEMKCLGERRRNVVNSFRARPEKLAAAKNVILVDDVTTSGATFAEAARALKAAGVRRIFALAAAKA